MPLIRASNAAPKPSVDAVATTDRSTIAQDLGSADIDVRRTAVRVATRFGEAKLLAGHLAAETDHGLRETILTSLVRIGGVKAAGSLISLLSSEDAHLRNAVIETVQAMGDDALPEIEALLEDKNSDLRIYAVNILLSLSSPRVPDIALKVIASDPHVNVCAAAVDILAETGRSDMTEALRAVAARFPSEPFLAFAVRAAIKRIG